jgi:hypothetical protein
MSIQLFNITTDLFTASASDPSPVATAAGSAAAFGSDAPPPPPPPSVGVISNMPVAITFAGAPTIITVVWKVLGAVVPSLASPKLLPILLSLIVGMLIYWQSAPVVGTMKEKTIGFCFALLNSFVIAATVLGIDSTMAVR